MKRGRKDFFSGVLLLTLSAMAAKICGSFFKIPLVSVIGDAGMGYFNSAYVIYTFFYVLSTSGLPLGLSILVSGSLTKGEQNRYLTASLVAFGGMGVLFGALMFLFPGHLALLVGNEGATRAIRVMAPGLLCVCLSGCVRGYFQGLRDMMPTAISQTIEALVKTAGGLLLARLAAVKGEDGAACAAAALFGVTLGSVCSLIYLLGCLYVHRKREETALLCKAQGGVYKRLIAVVLPVSMASIVLSISSVIDLSVMMHGLVKIGYSQQQANALYGNYTGTAVSLFSLPPVLIAPIASAIVPFLAQVSSEEKKERCELSLRLTSLIAAPCAFGLLALSKPILVLLFGVQSGSMGAPLLQLLAPSVYLVALQTVSGSLLQASAVKSIPVGSLVIGALLKVAVCQMLIGRLGIFAAPLGTLFCYGVAAGINIFYCVKKRLLRLNFYKTLILPLFCGVLCGLCARGCYLLLGKSHVATVLSIFIAAAVYLVLVLLTGAFDRRMAVLLPFLKKLDAVFYKKRRRS